MVVKVLTMSASGQALRDRGRGALSSRALRHCWVSQAMSPLKPRGARRSAD
jgi:hypothetical protein